MHAFMMVFMYHLSDMAVECVFQWAGHQWHRTYHFWKSDVAS